MLSVRRQQQLMFGLVLPPREAHLGGRAASTRGEKKNRAAALALLAGWTSPRGGNAAARLQSSESGSFPRFVLLVLFGGRRNTMRAIFPSIDSQVQLNGSG